MTMSFVNESADGVVGNLTFNKTINTTKCIYTRSTMSTHFDVFIFMMFVPVMTSIIVLGCIGNTLTIIVLNRERKTTSNFLLKALALLDILYLLTELFYFSLPCLYKYTGYAFAYNVFFNLIKTYLGFIMWIFKYGSNYIVLLMTVERYVAVCHPMKAAKLCTMRRVRIYTAGVVLLCIVFNIPKIWYYKVTYVYDVCTNRTLPLAVATDLYAQNDYFRIIYVYCLYMIILYSVPLAVLLVLNVLLIKSVIIARQRRVQMTADHNQTLKKSDNVTHKIIGVVTAFIFLESPAIILNGLYLVHDQLDVDQVVLFSALQSTYTLFAINSFINFFLYCLVAQRFRNNLRRVLTCQSRDRRVHGGKSSVYFTSSDVNTNVRQQQESSQKL